jgi:hypothetical protein
VLAHQPPAGPAAAWPSRAPPAGPPHLQGAQQPYQYQAGALGYQGGYHQAHPPAAAPPYQAPPAAAAGGGLGALLQGLTEAQLQQVAASLAVTGGPCSPVLGLRFRV